MVSRFRSSALPAPTQSRWLAAWVCVFLASITWLAFGQTLRHGFVNYDDPSYVYENPAVTGGLTLAGVKRAFTQSHARNWHPLTTCSHMLDCQLFGVRAGGHHFINVVLHMIAVLLLFFLLYKATHALWRSAFVAALFAIHPLRVESVAWVAERKDVLSGVFFMLTLAAYVRYVRNRSVGRYLIVMLLFAFGLMSKPMLVTLPFVLLLMDYWPLGRLAPPVSRKSQTQLRGWRNRSPLLPLLVEKLPLLALSAAAGLITFLVQKTGGVQSDPLPLGWRLGNAVVSYVIYIWQMVWPEKLAPYYPHPESQLPVWQIALALGFLIAFTFIVFFRRRNTPYLITGWFWYLGMLLPVIGIIQVGSQGWADRYTYLPQIGLYVCLTWAFVDLSNNWPHRREILGAGMTLLLALLTWITWNQTSYWRDSESLWIHTLAVTSANAVVHNNLGEVLYKRGQTEEALSHYEKALEIRSRDRTSRHDFLLALSHANIGTALRRKGLLDDAISHYQKAVELQPDYAQGCLGLGSALNEKGRTEDAITALRKAVTIQPEYAEAYVTLGDAFLQQRMDQEAIAQYQRALEIAPDAVVPLNNLAWLFATSADDSIRNGPKAVLMAERAVQVSGGQDPLFLHKLAAAYAATGDFPRAVETAQRAQRLAADQGNTPLANELRRNISIYRTNNPLSPARR